MKSFLKFIYNKFRLRNKHVKFFCTSSISISAKLEGRNLIDKDTVFVGEMGLGSYIGTNSKIDGKIGRFSSIGVNCWIYRGRHLFTYPYVTTSPMFFSLAKQTGCTFASKQEIQEHVYADKMNRFPIIIENDCWINSDVKFVEGVTVHDGAVVLAGAVVTKDVPAYAIVGGVPAKVIRYRYSQEDIEFLLKIKWWENNYSWFQKNADLLLNIENLKKYYSNDNN